MTEPNQESCAFICAPAPVHYTARVRKRGARRYTCGPERKNKRTAMRDMLRLFEDTKDAKRADVLAWYEWYDPMIVCELVDVGKTTEL